MEMKNYNIVQWGDSASYRAQKNEAEERGEARLKRTWLTMTKNLHPEANSTEL